MVTFTVSPALVVKYLGALLAPSFLMRPHLNAGSLNGRMTPSESSAETEFPRPLTAREHELAKWMLEHGHTNAAPFLDQLSIARVVSGCDCGCASIHFEVEGRPKPPGGVHILGDYLFGDDSTLCGAFVFESGGTLAGLEVYGLAGPALSVLPEPKDLRPFETDQSERPLAH